MRAYRTPPEDAGDFYVFSFEDGRIFRRVRTYEGRAPFLAYLVGSVLGHLVLEWRRGKREIETVPTEDFAEFADEAGGAFSSAGTVQANVRLPTSDSASGDGSDDPMDLNLLNRFLETVDPAKTVVLKLLHVEDYDLTPAEIRHLAEISGRSVAEVLQAVERLRATVRGREAAAKGIEDKLEAVQAWIQLYERRLRRIAEDITALPPTSMAAAHLREEQVDLERKIERRRQQRENVLARRQRRKVTAPYKEIAALLNTSVGNVGSQITRLRQEILAGLGGQKQGMG
jgi:DNA-directed RNA polymerase specialized sigma24 family protein